MNLGRPAAARSGGDAVARCRRLVEPALREAVSVLHPWSARMAAFTLGWSDADGRPHGVAAGGAGGKGLRPAVVLLGAEAVGGSAESALPGAVAVELVHAFSLVHDDIIDRDEQRRHREALWKAYGVGPALLAGDALLALAVKQLASAPAAMTYLSRALVELVQGQTADMAFENRPWSGPNAVTVEEYTRMAAGKTGGLLGAAAAIGVALGGAPELAERMWGLGRDLGVAFQIADDVLGIWGDPLVTGKPVHSDLRRDKKTLPVLAALASGGQAAHELGALLASGAADDASLRRAACLVDEAGGRTASLALAERYLSSAEQTMDECLPDAADLRDLFASLVDRIS
ncbi:polyprenyl synthetase family protein [Nonomuraea sp. NN258]|uniref:polyprenyl synthetase family protein n=1 Tax=Nonomuraea antri TaxID=2730852 RepID=UPI00156A17E0|nr:polyprenyl synthetase family protein [Nonomuraea antri]NRQ31770.1 polyprenyl synthetase family protein [Nonomuraea antri]